MRVVQLVVPPADRAPVGRLAPMFPTRRGRPTAPMKTTLRLAGLLLTLLLALVAAPGTAGACHHAGSSALSVTPEMGPAGTAFTLAGAGFDAGDAPTVEVFDETWGLVASHAAWAGEEGDLVVTLDSAGYAPGTYIVLVTTSDGSQLGAVFTITAAVDGVDADTLNRLVP